VSKFVVVIEGCDKTGKSTLAGLLAKDLGWPVVKMNQPRTPGPHVAAQECLDVLGAQKGPFIADRFHLGESVYGPIYRGTLPMDHVDMRLIETRLQARGCLLVLMTDSVKMIIARFKALKEDFAKEGDVRDIVEKYQVEWERSRLAKIRARLSSTDLARTVVSLVRAEAEL